jgi:D-alanyl-D-alanine carboxypeptidase (penicillin-binding protein 5/6)
MRIALLLLGWLLLGAPHAATAPAPQAAAPAAKPATPRPAAAAAQPAATAPDAVPAPPAVQARAQILVDANSGKVLAEQEADTRLDPASLTKMMTAYVVFDALRAGKVRMSDQVAISEKAWRMGGSKMFIEVGKTVGLEDLLKGLIVQSGNDASVALAEHVAGSEDTFAALMNRHAERMGMSGTHFVDASGMPDPRHYTTARDMATLARALVRDFPELYPMHAVKEYTFNGIKQHNRNRLLWQDASVDGIKTGHTEAAGYCLVASAQREGMRLVSVVMGAASEKERARMTQELLNYGYRFYETRRLYGHQDVLGKARVWKGEPDVVDAGVAEDLYVTLPRGQYDRLAASTELDPEVMAPIARGARVGTLRLTLASKPYLEVAVVSLQPAAEGGFWRWLVDTVALWFQ